MSDTPMPASTSPVLNAREQRRSRLLLVLAALFLTNALLAELVGGKLFQVPTRLSILGRDNFRITLSCGIILWPVVFIMTDIINEYFGRGGVKRLSYLAAAMIAYAFVGLWIADKVPTVDFSPITADAFRNVFLQSQFIIVGSIIAFLIAQLVDVTVFWIIRKQTGHKHLWLRATGSTIISQIVDTYVVGFIGLYLPFVLKQRWPAAFAGAGGVPFHTYLEAQTAGYIFKLLIAVGVTPVLYVVHAIVDRYLGPAEAHQLIETTAKREHADDAEVLRDRT
jgi:queuosine precursor transporter